MSRNLKVKFCLSKKNPKYLHINMYIIAISQEDAIL